MSAEPVLWALFYMYMAIELAFYALFHFYMVPKANELVEPQPYRDYGKDRCRVIFRIFNRALAAARIKGMDQRTALKEYIYACFDPIPEDERLSAADDSSGSQVRPESSSTSSTKSASPIQSGSFPSSMFRGNRESVASGSSDSIFMDEGISFESNEEEEFTKVHQDTTNPACWTVDGIGREDMSHLFSWALFCRPLDQFSPWEHQELKRCFDEMERQLGMVFPPGSGGRYKARRLSLENVDPLHRPLLVYFTVLLSQMVVAILLRLAGYQRVFSKKTGVTGWYRPVRMGSSAERLLPLIFFHGIAPGGLIFYLPFVLLGLANDGRACFLFENQNISCRLGFHALTEAQTVDGVKEILDKCLDNPNADLALVGHSFGSVPLTWLLHSTKMQDRIRQFVLLDPVVILLSKPDVMVNFVYRKGLNKIRMLVGSELFTEWYLRRHFFFYNSELWLDDIPARIQPILALSEKDEVVNANDVKDHVAMFSTSGSEGNPLKVLFWKGTAHGGCLTSISKWRDIKSAMLQQELRLVQTERH